MSSETRQHIWRPRIHNGLLIIGLLFIVIGLPFSNVMMSTGQFVIAGNWILEGRYAEKLRSLFKNKLALILISLYVLHVLGLLWTTDVAYGLRDLRIKLPLFLLPFLLFTSPLISKKQYKWLLGIFVLSVTITSFFSYAIYLGYTGEEILNRRKMTFIPHIRFALMNVLAMGIVSYYLIRDRTKSNIVLKFAMIATVVWLFYFQVLLESASGFAALAVLLAYLVLRGILHGGGKYVRLSLAVVAVVGAIGTSVYINSIYEQHYYEIPFEESELEQFTATGREYLHRSHIPYRENGHRVYNYVQMDEMENEWSMVSKIDFNGVDSRGQVLWSTLMRYMTSKGLKKDSLDFQQLTTEDIESIEKGVTNFKMNNKWGVANRLNGFLWEIDKYQFTGDATNSSLILRFVYLQAAWDIFKQNWLSGIGTGDLRAEFNRYYKEQMPDIPEKSWARAHNQFLTMFLTFGVFGGLWFLVSLGYPIFTIRTGLLYGMFIIILLVSMLADDTLETQAGVTLFAFFNVFLLWRNHSLSPGAEHES